MRWVQIENGRFHGRLLYLRGENVIVGTTVTKGQVIALSANMAEVYGGGMTNHIHFQVQLTNNTIVRSKSW